MARETIAVFNRFGKKLSKALWSLLSIPIYYKILGIGALVAVLFGTVVGYKINEIASNRLYSDLEERAISRAGLLSYRLTRPLVVDDLPTAREVIRNTIKISGDIVYVLVEKATGEAAVHSFKKTVPKDLLTHSGKDTPPEGEVANLLTDRGLVIEARFPVLEGKLGIVRVGFSDKRVVAALGRIRSSFLWTLAVCMVVGQALALLLAYVLTKPIQHLMMASESLSSGDFSTRSEIYSNDEIGKLAKTFNSMAEGLETSAKEIHEKEQVRLALVRKVVSSQEEERKRIARELHDETGQSLNSLLLQVESFDIKDTKNLALQEEIEKNICTLINDIKRIAFALRPSLLDDLGLNYALEHYVQDLEKHSGISMDFQYTAPDKARRLPQPVEVTLYRIAQEAITNAVRHAKANNVSVVLICLLEGTTLVVEDNGIGFKQHEIQLANSQGLGILGMRERVALIGGELIIESSHGQGTTVRARIKTGGNVASGMSPGSG
ncbi:MAG: HAMP domain-containing sensor histidine kinase [Proteobacteria bacterium]|nr:HAMP domain-containing sensor histidine kinase [Pseudomonadota bacterium]